MPALLECSEQRGRLVNSEQYRLCSEACTEIPGATEPTRDRGQATQRREPFQLWKDETSFQVTRPGKCEGGRRRVGAVRVHRTRAAKGACALEDG